MPKKMIDGVTVRGLKMIPDERGRLMEILRADHPEFSQFGQVYLTTAYPGVVKAWHYHKLQDDNMTVVRGMAKIVLFDDREGSPTRGTINEFFVGDHNHVLVHIPRQIWHGFKCISENECLVINVVTECYRYDQPDEYRRPPHGELPYDWNRSDG